MSKLTTMIAEHKLLAEETHFELSELNKFDLSKFSAKEKLDIENSINELQTEYSMRKCFIDELETLL